MTPMKAIRAKCLDCCCDDWRDVKTCPVPDCPLYQYRFGHNPNIKREMSEDRKKEIAERLQNARQAKTPTL